ncbi:MAG: sulfatase [bacterium]
MRRGIRVAAVGLLLAAATWALWPRAAAPNVLLITIDTLRADHLLCYGQALATSPNIDAFAARSAVFDRAIAASGYTAPAHTSIMTSRYPRRQSLAFGNGSRTQAGAATLADAFQRAGYATAAFVSNAVLNPKTGLNQGFEVYDADLPTAEAKRPTVYERLAPQTLERALAWLAKRRQQPYFLWVHFQDPHGPYTPPEPYRAAFQQPPVAGEPELPLLGDNSGRGGIPPYQALDGTRRASEYEARYAGEIAFMDHSVGQLIAAVEGDGPSIVALTADHGESFGENGFFFAHGHSAAPDLSHIPLILSAPGMRAERRAELVSQVDILPTLLELAGVARPSVIEGIPLGPILDGRAALPARAIFCDIGYEVAAYGPEGFLLAATPEDKTWSLAEFYQSGRAAQARAIVGAEQLTVTHTFRWDGGKTWSASDADASLATHLASYLVEGSAIGAPVSLDPADRERLRALGYAAP